MEERVLARKIYSARANEKRNRKSTRHSAQRQKQEYFVRELIDEVMYIRVRISDVFLYLW